MLDQSLNRALSIVEGNGIKVIQVPIKRPDSGGILLAPIFAGICGTDLQILRGERHDRARILGHEGIGEIVDICARDSEFFVGQKVVFNPVNPNDQDDILGHSTDGIFQQLVQISLHDVDRGILIPSSDRLPLIAGILVEPLGAVIYGFKLVSQVNASKNVAIFGAGTIGLLSAIYAKEIGCENVFLVHNSPSRLAWAVQNDIVSTDETILIADDVSSFVMNMTNGVGVDAVFVCTPPRSAHEVLAIAFNCIRNEGCIDLVGGILGTNNIPGQQVINFGQIRRANVCGRPDGGFHARTKLSSGKTVLITGHRGTSQAHLVAAMGLLIERFTQYMKVITHVVPFESSPEFLLQLIRSNSRIIEGREFVKGVIAFQER